MLLPAEVVKPYLMTVANRSGCAHCPKQLLWRGEEAMEAALQLLRAAQQHADGAERISWAQPLLRPAADAKQARAFAKLLQPQQPPGSIAAGRDDAAAPLRSEAQLLVDRVASHGMASASGQAAAPHQAVSDPCSGRDSVSVRAVSEGEAAAAVPGLREAPDLGADGERSAALWITGAHVVHPERYLRSTPRHALTGDS